MRLRDRRAGAERRDVADERADLAARRRARACGDGCSSGLRERHVAGAEVEVGGERADVRSDGPVPTIPPEPGCPAAGCPRRAVPWHDAQLRRVERRRPSAASWTTPCGGCAAAPARPRARAAAASAARLMTGGTARGRRRPRPLSRMITRKSEFPSDDAVDEEVDARPSGGASSCDARVSRGRATIAAPRPGRRRRRRRSSSESSTSSTPSPAAPAGVAARLRHAVAERRAAPPSERGAEQAEPLQELRVASCERALTARPRSGQDDDDASDVDDVPVERDRAQRRRAR